MTESVLVDTDILIDGKNQKDYRFIPELDLPKYP